MRYKRQKEHGSEHLSAVPPLRQVFPVSAFYPIGDRKILYFKRNLAKRWLVLSIAFQPDTNSNS